jgi:hypothetical protein
MTSFVSSVKPARTAATHEGLALRLVRSVSTATSTVADTFRMAHELKAAGTAEERRQIVQDRVPTRRAA